ncbi:MAG TPA: universal stress protein [Ktedonobacteraceae bacterium]|nr:universal stress protein [Ktedonobacteraceae bacterium]
MIHHVLVPTDGSENADRAVQFSAQVADRRQQAEVTVVYVHLRVIHPAIAMSVLTPENPVGMSPVFTQEEAAANSEELAQAQAIVDRAVAEIRSLVTSSDVTVSGRVVEHSRVDEGILQAAEDTHAEIIVVGTRGLSPLRSAIMGSVSHSLIEKATCPVLIVK